MPARSHVGWGFLLSLLLHATGIAALSLALPRLNVRPGVLRHVDFAVVSKPVPVQVPEPEARAPEAAAQPARADEPAIAASAVEVIENPSASVELAPARAATPAPVAAPKPARKAPTKPLTAAPPAPQPTASQPTASTPSQLPTSTHADPRSDGSALQRVLRQIASTSELTQDERRRAMLIVLRTWEDPSGKHSAEDLVDALIKGVRQARTDAGTK
jgi:hypothetical protein